MALTREFKSTIRDRAQRDANFRKALLIEAVNSLLADELDIAKSVLKDYINASILFETLAKRVDKTVKVYNACLALKEIRRLNHYFP